MCLGDVVVAFLAVCRWRRESEVVQCCLSLEMGDFTLNYDGFFGLTDESDDCSDPELENSEALCGEDDDTPSSGGCDESLSHIDFDPVGR